MESNTFIPLDLWRASSLAAETQLWTRKYEHAVKNDPDEAGKLKELIVDRISALEDFFVANVDDERAVLFEKQRLKLRKLLHEYHTSDKKPRAAAPAVVKDTTRLTATGLSAWFLQAGHRELRGVTEDALQRAYANLSRHSPDGMLSIADIRDWYRTVRAADGAGGSAGGSDGAASTGTKSVAGSTRSARRPKARKPLYAWEKKAMKEAKKAKGIPPASDTSDSEVERDPEGLPGDVLEFQVRLTEKEFKRFVLLKRRAEAEAKHMTRARKNMQKSKARAEHINKERGASGIAVSGPYVEPAVLQEYMYRQDQRSRWVVDEDFRRTETKAVGTA